MKITGISDLHGYLPNNIPKADVLCICGDIFPLEYQRDIITSTAWFCLRFLPWINNLPVEHVIFIGGNHDFLLEHLVDKKYYSPKSALKTLCLRQQINKDLIFLHNTAITIDGVTFYGTPYCPDLKYWAFYKSSEDLNKTFETIPATCDVILTHCPPKIGELATVHKNGLNGPDFGCVELANSLANKNFKLLMCGHVHSGTHQIVDWNGAKLVNVSLLDEEYHPFYAPTEIDL